LLLNKFYRPERPNAAAIETQVDQLALYVVFESGEQMLADNPTLYYRTPDFTEFITRVPTTKTKPKRWQPLSAKLL
jgi:alpha-glucosidase